MKYVIRASVESDSFTPRAINVETPEFIIRIESKVSSESTKNYLTVIAKIEDYEMFLPQFRKVEKGHHELLIHHDFPIRKKAIDMLHYIESMGSFWLGIGREDMQSLEEKWIPENEEEKQMLTVKNITLNQYYPRNCEQIDPEIFVRIIAKKKDYDHLIVPLAFYRVGKLEYNNFNYYLAFVSFYLFLDCLFSKGKFREDDVVTEFKGSKVLREAVQESIDYMKANSEKQKEVSVFFDKQRLNIGDVDNVILFLVKTRGNLFHYSQHDSREKNHMLNQNELQPLVFLILVISVKVVARLANNLALHDHINHKM